MTEHAVLVEALGKRYPVRHDDAMSTYRTLREAVQRFARSPLRALRGAATVEEFWALRDVSFEVPHGQALAIIGRNGAGKSTLLKILSEVTPPSEGRARLRGRVGALLEVGTGFHPELTGRENVFLNGAILGMSRRDITARFDDIVQFAEVERFVDTPVKRYSSGMYLRLAFAVAAHLEPDILVVDEVLAVGDAAFQARCLAKMESETLNGRTVLFVSHNLPAVVRLCSRAILLDGGRLVDDGLAADVTGRYLAGVTGAAGSRSWTDVTAPGKDGFRLRTLELCNHDGQSTPTIDIARPASIKIGFELDRPLRFRFAVNIRTQGTLAFSSVEPEERDSPAGTHIAEVAIPANLLAEGEHSIGLSVFASRGAKIHYAVVDDALAFEAVDRMDGTSARGDYAGNLLGVVRPRLEWSRRQ